MFSMISRHISKHLITSTIFLVIVLVTGVWLTQSLRFIEIIVNKNISIGGYFSFVGFMIPDLLVLVFPICTLIATIFTYNRLIADNEMAIFRACGLSNLQIARPALCLAAFFVALSGFINIYIVPLSFQKFRNLEHQIKTEISSNIIQEGVFNSVRNATIYAKKRGRKDDLYGVFIHHQSNIPNKPPYSIIANHGFLSYINNRLQLILFDGNRQEKDEKTGKITFLHFSKLTYDLTSSTKDVEERSVKPYERPLSELLYPPDADKFPPSTLAKMRSEGHQRIISPLTIFIFSIIACATMLSGQYNRKGRRNRVLMAVVVAALTQIGTIFFLNMSAKIPYIIPILYIFLIIVTVISFAILFSETFFLNFFKRRPS